jgi:hypothetical protein
VRELRPRLVNIGESSRRAGLAVRSTPSNGKRFDHKHVLFRHRNSFKRSRTQGTRNRRTLLVISKDMYRELLLVPHTKKSTEADQED